MWAFGITTHIVRWDFPVTVSDVYSRNQYQPRFLALYTLDSVVHLQCPLIIDLLRPLFPTLSTCTGREVHNIHTFEDAREVCYRGVFEGEEERLGGGGKNVGFVFLGPDDGFNGVGGGD